MHFCIGVHFSVFSAVCTIFFYKAVDLQIRYKQKNHKFQVDRSTMGASFIPIAIVSCFWGVVGLVLPCYVPNDTNKGVVQLVLRLTGATCWLFWLCCYMAQMNPLIGPKLHNTTVLLMAKAWGNDIIET